MANLSSSTIEWAIEHLSRYHDTTEFPRAFEFEAIKYNQDEVVKALSKQDICQWHTRVYRRCLVPKHRYGFRVLTQLDPLDTLFYLALILETGEYIEKSRVSKDKGIVFSYRFLQDDTDHVLFDRNVSFSEFQQKSETLANEYPFVVLADIADFYPRIYLHRLENALISSLRTLPSHAKAIIQLIKGWNQNVSYGIPVGNNPSRLIAELVIDDVDRTLFAEDMIFVRYVDDYRIFCKTRQEAYQCLARLANVLYETHGMTLQSQKTKIVTSEEFVNDILESEERKELRTLAADFGEILFRVGIDSYYEDIDISTLPSETQNQINGLNLVGMLNLQLDADEIDIPMTKFLLNRLGFLKQDAPLVRLLNEMDKIYPVFPEFIRYLLNLEDVLEEGLRERIGKYLLGKLRGSVVSHLEFHRMQIMTLFAQSKGWGNAEKLAGFYNFVGDNWFRRSLLLALGKSEQYYWLRPKKFEMEQMPAWEKRAFIYAASSFPKDERENYFRALTPRLDILERYITYWSQKNPINM